MKKELKKNIITINKIQKLDPKIIKIGWILLDLP